MMKMVKRSSDMCSISTDLRRHPADCPSSGLVGSAALLPTLPGWRHAKNFMLPYKSKSYAIITISVRVPQEFS